MPFGCDLWPLAAHSDLGHDAGMDDDHELIPDRRVPATSTPPRPTSANSKRVKHGLEVKAAALVTKDADGQPHVVEAHNKHGRVAAGMGAGWA